MEIENSRMASVGTLKSDQGAPVENQGKEDKNPSSESSTTAGNSDRLSSTGEARQLQDLASQLATEPVVDSQRVEAVRSAVENGTFSVNPDRIADKMISLEQALTDAR